MEILFLGTGSMVPTATRNHSGILLSHTNEHLLIDCGEGTQRQLRIAGFPPPKITKILLTHWHGDHYFGLPGLIENLAKNNYHGTLELFGPKGTKARLAQLLTIFTLERRIPIKVHEITKDGIFYTGKDYSLLAHALNHSIPCIAYTFLEHDKRKINIDYVKKIGIPQGPILGTLQEGKPITFKGKKITPHQVTFLQKGKKIVFILDTNICANIAKAAKEADILVADSTFSSALTEKAEEYKHLTAAQAATIAKKAKAKKLILTHFSQRYKNVDELLAEATAIFPHTIAADDFMKISV